MLKHVECEMSKQEIIEIIVREYDKAYEAARNNPSAKTIYHEEAMKNLLKHIPIFERS